MNIYLYELKSQRKSAIIWTCTMIALAVLFLSIYPDLAKDANDFKACWPNILQLSEICLVLIWITLPHIRVLFHHI